MNILRFCYLLTITHGPLNSSVFFVVNTFAYVTCQPERSPYLICLFVRLVNITEYDLLHVCYSFFVFKYISQWITNHMIRSPNLDSVKYRITNPVSIFVIRPHKNSWFGFGTYFYGRIRDSDSLYVFKIWDSAVFEKLKIQVRFLSILDSDSRFGRVLRI